MSIYLSLSLLTQKYVCFFSPQLCSDLGEHGFLVEGSLAASKKETVCEAIPYKYVVYRKQKNVYDYEHIYKPNTDDVVNRCLFVKPGLLNNEGN